MSAARLPLRLARREVRRRPGRTTLVALLVALPVAGMVLATVTIHTGSHTPAEEWARRNGTADAVATDPSNPLLTTGLPTGSRVLTVTSTYARVRTTSGFRSDAELSDAPLDDPLVAGVEVLVTGRAPAKAGEVAVSRRVARRLHVQVGGDLDLARPGLRVSVVGVVEPVGCLSCTHIVFAPGSLPDAVLQRYGIGQLALVDLPAGLSAAQVDSLRQAGLDLRVDVTAPAHDPARDRSVRWSLVLGAIALTVVGIVISAAFAVGARRQLVTLGQLSASGASPSVLRSALVLQGTITGVIGGVAGLALAGVVLGVGRSLFERILDERIHHYAVSSANVLSALAIGVVAATLSALIPARAAARIPTLAALAGRRPLAPVSRRLVAGGFVAMAGGLGLLGLAVVGSRSGGDGELWALVAIIGGVGQLLGACAIAPAVVARLEPLAHRLSGGFRLAARSLARNRARTGAVVSAVAATGALAVCAGALVLGTTESDVVDPVIPDDIVVITRHEYNATSGDTIDAGLPDEAALAEARALLPGARGLTVRGSATVLAAEGAGVTLWSTGIDHRGMPEQPAATLAPVVPSAAAVAGARPAFERAIVADPALLDAIHADAALRGALDDTGLVVLTGFGNLSILVTPPGASAPVRARAVHHHYTVGSSTQLLISPHEAQVLGIEVVPVAMLFRTPEPVTNAQRDGLEDLQYDNTLNGSSGLTVEWAFHRGGPTPLQVELMLSGIALVFSLFVVGASLALAAAESKDERDIFTIAGAPPGALARSAGARAWLLALIGGAMAIPVGFLPVVVFAYASHDGFFGERFPLVFPTRTALLLLLAVPAIVSAASFASSSVSQRLRPVRVSTATFE